MLNLVLLFSFVLSTSVFGSVDKAIYRIKGITYFQSDVDGLVQTFVQTKRCIKRKMSLEKFIGVKRFSTITTKKNRQTLVLAKVIQYATFTGSKKRDLLLKKVFKGCLNENNYNLLSAEYFIRNSNNHTLVKSEINRNLTHYFYNKEPTSKLWEKN